jgi:hypothetical protein
MGVVDDARAYLALIGNLDWGQLTADLVLHGVAKKHLSPDLAEQIAADTVVRVCDPARSPWDPSRGAHIFTHLVWVFDSELSHFRDKRKRRKTASMGDDLPEPPPDSEDDPDVRATRQGTLAVLREKLYAALAKRPLALALLALEEDDGVSDVDEQVARTGKTRAQVYEARRVLAETARTILAEGDHHLSRERSALEREKKVAE